MAVLDAVLELFEEGNLDPGVHEVADRSGVSLRSVYRYFEDLDELITAAIERHLERTRPLFDIERIGEGPLPERINRFADRRLRLFDAMRVIYRASRVRAATDPQVQAGLMDTYQWLGEQAHQMFAPELDQIDDPAERLEARHTVDLLTQFDSLEHLRHRCGAGSRPSRRGRGRSLNRVLA